MIQWYFFYWNDTSSILNFKWFIVMRNRHELCKISTFYFPPWQRGPNFNLKANQSLGSIVVSYMIMRLINAIKKKNYFKTHIKYFSNWNGMDIGGERRNRRYRISFKGFYLSLVRNWNIYISNYFGKLTSKWTLTRLVLMA